MGVDNLLGFVKNATTQTQIEETSLPNSSAAVDISHWIYRASYACPEALYHRTNLHQAYSTIINYIDNYVKLLKFHNVQLTFVFDGMKLPAKHVTHKERSAKKAESRTMVEKLLASKNFTEARKFMLRCIEIKFDVIQQVIRYCQQEGISYIVAPYEADAQIAFLNNNDICQYIITEDTDLILYGCQKIIYKLDVTGKCVLYERSKLAKCFGPHGAKMEFEKFRRICILSGCDYLKNIPSVGLQSAKKFFTLTKQDDLNTLLPKLATYLKAPKLAGKVTKDYIEGFIAAETTFKHHIVWDPVNEKLKPIEPYSRGKSSSDYPLAGKKFHDSQARELVQGNINLDSIDPERDLDSTSDFEDDDDDDNENGAQSNHNSKQTNSDCEFTIPHKIKCAP